MAKEIDVDPAEFAEYLRAERERRQLTLDQIADETKIAPRHLAALERGDVRNWPGGMYRRAMMRAYAESIGVDREYALQQFERAFEPKPEPVPQPPLPAPPPLVAAAAATSHTRGIGIVTLGLVVAALAIAGWRAASGPSVPSAPREVAAATESAAVRAAAPQPSAAVVPASAASVPAARLEPPARASQPTSDGAAATAGTAPPPLPAPAPAPARVETVTEGNLRVTTTPAGARVTVNGIGWGEAPIVIKNLPLGAKRVRVTLDGYISQERVVQLSSAQPDVRVTLALRARE